MMEENREQERKEQQGPGADGRDDDALKGSAGEYVERKRWLFFGLPFTFTKYTINEQVVTINAGLFSTTENDCYLYKMWNCGRVWQSAFSDWVRWRVIQETIPIRSFS